MSAESNGYTGYGGVEVLCPKTGVICPTRVQMVRLYSEGVQLQIDEELPREMNPCLDGMKLFQILADHEQRALEGNCEGLLEGECPIPIVEPPVRTRALGSIMKRITGNQ